MVKVPVTVSKRKIIYSQHAIDFDQLRLKLTTNESKYTTTEKLSILYRNIKRVIRFYEMDGHNNSSGSDDKLMFGINRMRGVCINTLIKLRFYQDYNLRRNSIIITKTQNPKQQQPDLTTEELINRGFNTLCFLRNSITLKSSQDVTELQTVHPSSPGLKITKKFIDKPIESKILRNLIEYEMYKVNNGLYYDKSNANANANKQLQIYNLYDFANFIKSTKLYYINELNNPLKYSEYLSKLTNRSNLWFEYIKPMRDMVDPEIKGSDCEVIQEPAIIPDTNFDDGKQVSEIINELIGKDETNKTNKNKSKNKKLLNLNFLNSSRLNSYRFERDLIYFNENNKLIL